MNTSHGAATIRPELTIRRIFDAPRELVFDCWTQEKHVERWLFPKDFTVPFSQSDARTGGSYRSCLRAPDGTDHWVGGTYMEVTPHDRIVFTHAWQDEAGNAEHETVVTITLKDIGQGRTQLTLHQAFFLSEASRCGHAEGWKETLDNLERYLAA
ncbi:SRPBCC domain-containing protein [Sinorhizobium medicae]|uniref:SRPBCC family protein n=1 Tax=Sinorhizobium medicae TaxID=110321 RepID=UPI000FD465A3|nr:SRPBCC domain-containing protein [Sinorhizobium medicae]MDX0630277.1 SRPBCC domain-containing protein [Sinorhizobium medicae]MDX0882937.1 SRPBCC domain-containing protein [Sinorhizobium medicae]RVJ51284.1 SRPBCC domain-containing protein [Sinorhizobium medicae]